MADASPAVLRIALHCDWVTVTEAGLGEWSSFPCSGSNSFLLTGVWMHRELCSFQFGTSFFLMEDSLEREKELQVILVSGAVVSSKYSKNWDPFYCQDDTHSKVLLPLVLSSFPHTNNSVFPLPVMTIWLLRESAGAEEAASSRLRDITTGEICY